MHCPVYFMVSFSINVFLAARENFVISKPERDSTVANRLIGAALGIRLPKNLTSGASAASAKRAPSPVREDAWDD